MSESTVGRMLGHLVQRGVVQPVSSLNREKKVKRRQAKRSWAKRLKRGQKLKGDKPGAAVQIDTLTVHPQPGAQKKHYNAVCMDSRWNVAGVCEQATAKTAARFLDKLLQETPFPVTGIQIDGGSEFMAEFEDACREKGIPLHVLAPKSPELNGGVERLNRTWRDEFYDLYGDLPTKLAELRLETQNHHCIINHVRPHEALDLKTPAEYLDENYPEWAPQSHM